MYMLVIAFIDKSNITRRVGRTLIITSIDGVLRLGET